MSECILFTAGVNAVRELTNTEIANTNTRNKPSHHHVYLRLHRGDMDDIADDEEEDTKGQALSATPPVGSVGARESSQQRIDVIVWTRI
jgi:hypothetical protein